jgi:hypothetical protein
MSNGRKLIPHAEWLAQAERRFGDPPNWAFICPICKTRQTPQDLIDAGVPKEKINSYIGFSCIGRFGGIKGSGAGCDWTLGGLLRIHQTEVVMEDGNTRPVFEFAPDEKAEAAGGAA